MKNEEIGLFNPLKTDFERTHNLDNETKTSIIRSREIAYFPPHIARYMEKHLYNEIINTRNLDQTRLIASGDDQKILEEIRVHE